MTKRGRSPTIQQKEYRYAKCHYCRRRSISSRTLRVLLEECNVVLLNVFHHAMPALEWLSVHEVDIVFADIGMPEIDGLEFVERIKRTAKRQPEIVFTTAYEEHALRAFELAAADYLLKPIKNDSSANRA